MKPLAIEPRAKAKEMITTMLDTCTWTQPMSKLLGYGSELADALSRYADAELDPESTEQELIRTAYRNWIENCPNKEHLCFVDITFYNSDEVSKLDAMALVIAPHSDGANQLIDHYTNTLKGEFINQGYSLALNETFSAGIPLESGHELLEGLGKSKFVSSQTKIESGFLFRHLSDALQPNTEQLVQNSNAPLLDCTFLSIYEDRDQSKCVTSVSEEVTTLAAKSLEQQWNRWCEIWSSNSGRMQTSALGGSPCWLFGIPVGYRDIRHPGEFVLAATVYVAFDSGIETKALQPGVVPEFERAKESLRYLLVNLYEANSSAHLSRQYDLKDRNLAEISNAHEIRKVVSAINSSTSKKGLDLIRSYFSSIYCLNKAFPDTSFGLSELIKKKFREAIEIESMISQSQSVSIFQQHEDKFNQALEETVRDKSKYLELDASTEQLLSLTEDHRGWFEAALLAALRNTAFHAFKLDGPIKIQCSVKNIQGVMCLVITNTGFRFNTPTYVDSQKVGTKNALMAYVRGYKQNPRHVRLDRVVVERRDEIWHNNAKHLRPWLEEWITQIPLPGNSL